MKSAGWLLAATSAATLFACVTINVYFPAAAAEKAADRIIDEVWGEQTGRKANPAVQGRRGTAFERALVGVLDVLVPAAAAQANIDISTPAVTRLQASMSARHRELEGFYDSGAVGLTDEGLVTLRDANAVPLAQRPRANQLVAEENRDRNALYRAIAEANGHPEWEPDIRSTFARRWAERAKAGWWIESGGAWRQR